MMVHTRDELSERGMQQQAASVDDFRHFRRRHQIANLSLSYTEPLLIVRGRGQYLYDADGRRYLDAVNNVAHIGHSHEAVTAAAVAALTTVNTNTRYLSTQLPHVTALLLECAGVDSALTAVTMVNSGSEANELALRMAKAHCNSAPHRCADSADGVVLVTSDGYYGNTELLVKSSPYKFNGRGGRGCPPHVHEVPIPKHSAAISECADAVDAVIASVLCGGGRISAFIHETVVSCGGQIELPTAYLQRVYAAVHNAGGIVIADEVQTCLGRLGTHMFAYQRHHVRPDIVTLGKALGNGVPVGAVLCTAAVANAFSASGMEYFSTTGGSNMSCAVAAAVIATVHSASLMQSAHETGEYLRERLTNIASRYTLIADVRGSGLMFGVELVTSSAPATAETAWILNALRSGGGRDPSSNVDGVLLSRDGPHNNVIKIKPPMCFNHDDVDITCQRLEWAVKQITRRSQL